MRITKVDSMRQLGFSLVELITAIAVIAVLATGFFSAFSIVLKNTVSPLQLPVMENIAATQMDYLLAGTFQSAVYAPVSRTFNVDGTDYFAYFAVQSSVIAGQAVASGVHVRVTVDTANCASCVSLYGDTFDVQ